MNSGDLSIGAGGSISVFDTNLNTERYAENTGHSIDDASAIESADAIELRVSFAAEPTGLDRFVDRIQDLSGGPEKIGPVDRSDPVSTLGAPQNTSGTIAKIGTALETPPSYRELMQNFRSATTYAMEINLVGSAGTSMAGSMSKLMSGN